MITTIERRNRESELMALAGLHGKGRTTYATSFGRGRGFEKGTMHFFFASNHEEKTQASNEGQEPSPMDLSVDNSCDNRGDASCSHPTDQVAAKTSSHIQERDAQTPSSEQLISSEHVGGITKIVPRDTDGFDEYMNLVLDEAEEVNVKKNTRKQLGRILLKGDNITLMMNTYLSPLAAVPIVTLAGLGLFYVGFPGVARCIEIGLPALILLTFLSQYTSFSIIRRGIFDRFAVIFTVLIIWLYAHILTVAGVYRHRPPETQFSCRTDRSGLICGSPWY